MRPLPAPFDSIASGHVADIPVTGNVLLGSRLLTKEQAFPPDERHAFGLSGLLPAHVLTIEEQAELAMGHVRRSDDPLDRYITLAALQDRNATLFYRVLVDNIDELLPVVYTPTVGRACQEYSHILRRTRGVWITPHDRDRIPELLRSAPYEDVRLIVVTDNERILGLGDLGAGGMGIPIGKLALYTAAAGIYPALTLPVSLDVGTDNPDLLADPLYIGHRSPRLRGDEYDALIDAFVTGVEEVWPGCVIQWEDFKQQNALRILDRYRERVPSFNDDVQGTAAVVVAGVLAATGSPRAAHCRSSASCWSGRVVPGSASPGCSAWRWRTRACRRRRSGGPSPSSTPAVWSMPGGSTSTTRSGPSPSTPATSPFPAPPMGPIPGSRTWWSASPRPCWSARPVWPGPSAKSWCGRWRSGATDPVVMPLSNPTANSEAEPADVVAWTDGRALVATGSPFPPVEHDGRTHHVGQANNVFIFPGLGLGAIVAEATRITDQMILTAARTLASLVPAERLDTGALYPSVGSLRAVSRAIALAVAHEAVESGLGRSSPAMLDGDVEAAMWWPAYVPYRRA